MRQKAIIASIVLIVILIALVLVIPNDLTATANQPTPTPTYNILLGTRSPEDSNRGFPSPAPTLPPPTDLAPERPPDEKFLVVFSQEDGSNITFLALPEMIEDLVQKIGLDSLRAVYPPHFHMPRETDGELEAILTASASLTPVTELSGTPVPSAP
jgi:hypothetical protein